jgi:hypothetical protein
MGYACPVCEVPQVDGRHLANHVAFTALTGDSAHEDWLDAHVPGWGELGENELAGELVDHAEEADVETVFEESGVDAPAPDRRTVPDAALDEDTEHVLAEAMEYTRQMAEGAEGEGAKGEDGEGEDEAEPGSDDDPSADETE